MSGADALSQGITSEAAAWAGIDKMPEWALPRFQDGRRCRIFIT
jgi:hypothetical protein